MPTNKVSEYNEKNISYFKDTLHVRSVIRLRMTNSINFEVMSAALKNSLFLTIVYYSFRLHSLEFNRGII
jgi:hypothetical protein